MKIENPSLPMEQQLLLISISELLEAHHANTLDTMLCGHQLLVSAYRQIVSDNPGCNRQRLADSIADIVRKNLMEAKAE